MKNPYKTSTQKKNQGKNTQTPQKITTFFENSWQTVLFHLNCTRGDFEKAKTSQVFLVDYNSNTNSMYALMCQP